MSLRTYLFVAGGLMVVIGFLGLVEHVTIVPSSSNVGEFTCGTGFVRGPGGQPVEWVDKCDAATSARRMWAYPLLGVGLLIAMAGFVDRDKRKTSGGTARAA
ncbi:hypothetical protein [Saccharothrix sp. NRRL B-16314]|uniref:hypothetical protein n=1 Tax=Saccharothrix sp. NRRL B-16314 TaxID=1463825 RepID=UPI0012DC1988|nr:hypothetical protein [Saccharothrix sp. NRRL B-16314]